MHEPFIDPETSTPANVELPGYRPRARTFAEFVAGLDIPPDVQDDLDIFVGIFIGIVITTVAGIVFLHVGRFVMGF